MRTKRAKHTRSRIKRALLHISPYTIKFFSPLMLVLFIEFIWFAIVFCAGMAYDPIHTIDQYNSVSEHLMMSLLLTVGSAVMFDITMYESRKK